MTATLLTFITVPDAKLARTSKATPREAILRLDPLGFCLFAPTCVMLLLAVEWGGVTYAWKSAIVIGLICGAVALMAIFLLWERRRGDTAMIPLYLLKMRVVVCACGTMTLSQGSLMVVTYYVPLWFQVVKDASPTMGGVYYLPSVGSMVLGSMVTGALSKPPSNPLGTVILTIFYSFQAWLLHSICHRGYRFNIHFLRSAQYP